MLIKICRQHVVLQHDHNHDFELSYFLSALTKRTNCFYLVFIFFYCVFSPYKYGSILSWIIDHLCIKSLNHRQINKVIQLKPLALGSQIKVFQSGLNRHGVALYHQCQRRMYLLEGQSVSAQAFLQHLRRLGMESMHDGVDRY